MEYPTCPKCQRKYVFDAAVCAGCGHPLHRAAALRHAVPMWLKVIGGILAFGAVASALNGNRGPSADDQRWTAQRMCYEFVSKRLKAPATADFPSLDADGVKTWPRGEGFLVASYVDSENAFGAKVRQGFTCDVRPEKGTDTWHLVKLDFAPSL